MEFTYGEDIGEWYADHDFYEEEYGRPYPMPDDENEDDE